MASRMEFLEESIRARNGAEGDLLPSLSRFAVSDTQHFLDWRARVDYAEDNEDNGMIRMEVDSIPHAGHKRTADESPDNQPLAKRFHSLDLSEPYTLSRGKDGDPRVANASVDSLYHERTPPARPSDARVPFRANPPTTATSDLMQLDNSRHRVYIHDIDEELAEDEDHRPERSLSLYPEVERQVSRVPIQALTSGSNTSSGRELILYAVPSSISVPEEEDSVRRVIADARSRLRRQRNREQQEREYSDHPVEGVVDRPKAFASANDPDAMDVD